MNMFDEARSLLGMMNMRGMKQSELAKVLGVSQPYVANKLRLLAFSDGMQREITESGLSERHARCLLRLPNELRSLGLEKIKAGKMTVAQSEIMVDCMLEENAARAVPRGINTAERIGRFEKLLEESLANLRLFGIGATSKLEKFADKFYITVCIG